MIVHAKEVGYSEVFTDESLGVLRAYAPKLDVDRTVAVIDANHAAYRMCHTRELEGPQGEPTEALHGIVEMCRAIADATGIRQFVVVWDGDPSLRRMLYPAYKCRHDRERTPEEAAKHERTSKAIAIARSTIRKLGVPTAYHPKLEGDDMLGMVVGRLHEAGLNSLVVSDDHDHRQLLRILGCRVYAGIAKKILDSADYQRSHGIPASLHTVYKAFKGEPASGDNIPGIDSVGDVTAGKLVGAAYAALQRERLEGRLVAPITPQAVLERAIRTASQATANGRCRAVDRKVHAGANDARLSLVLSTMPSSESMLQRFLLRAYKVSNPLLVAVRKASELQAEVNTILDRVVLAVRVHSTISREAFMAIKGQYAWSTLTPEAMERLGVCVAENRVDRA